MTSRAAEIMASALEHAADAQESGTPVDLEATMQTTRQQVLPINDIPRPVFKLVLKFWTHWAQAAHNQWHDFSGIEEKDWPVMARTMAQHVRTGHMPNDRMIVEHFVRRRPVLSWKELSRLLDKNR